MAGNGSAMRHILDIKNSLQILDEFIKQDMRTGLQYTTLYTRGSLRKIASTIESRESEFVHRNREEREQRIQDLVTMLRQIGLFAHRREFDSR